MTSLLFHTDIFVPDIAKKPVYEGHLRYGAHARHEAHCDRYGEFELPACFIASHATLIEAEYLLDEEKVVKQVWRQPLDNDRDLVLVLTPAGFVKTVWTNLATDTHKSLNKKKYASGYAWSYRAQLKLH